MISRRGGDRGSALGGRARDDGRAVAVRGVRGSRQLTLGANKHGTALNEIAPTHYILEMFLWRIGEGRGSQYLDLKIMSTRLSHIFVDDAIVHP